MEISEINGYDYTEFTKKKITSDNSWANATKYAIKTYAAHSSAKVKLFSLHGAKNTTEDHTFFVPFPKDKKYLIAIHKAENFDPANPIYEVKLTDCDGMTTSRTIAISEVEVSRCDGIEMYTYTYYLTECGLYPKAQNIFTQLCSSFGEHTMDQSYYNKVDWMDLMQKNMQMDYEHGNITGYLAYKDFHDYLTLHRTEKEI